MDLSAIIFVVLAVAWAVYLIPKALKHHDELASDRLVEGHSDRVRILSRHGRGTEVAEAREVLVEESVPAEPAEPAGPAEPVAPVRASRPVPTRAAARRAARKRRRVLTVLVLALAVVGALAGLAIVPLWSVGVPAALVVLFLVVARLSVRRTQRTREATYRPVHVDPAAVPDLRVAVTAGRPVVEDDRGRPVVEVDRQARLETTASQDLVDLLAEDTDPQRRQEVEAVLADDGSLWDPLPMTLPTYVNKARARRTVRTIELTGINSSGHDEADTALAREAEASQQAEKPATGERKVAGA